MVKFQMGGIALKDLILAILSTDFLLVAQADDVDGTGAEGHYKLYGIVSGLTISVTLWCQNYWR